MSIDELKKAWDGAPQGVKDCAWELIHKSVDVASAVLSGAGDSVLGDGDLKEALAAAKALDHKLAAEVEVRKQAADLALRALEVGSKIALRLALAAL